MKQTRAELLNKQEEISNELENGIDLGFVIEKDGSLSANQDCHQDDKARAEHLISELRKINRILARG